jgi:hypothetical protein
VRDRWRPDLWLALWAVAVGGGMWVVDVVKPVWWTFTAATVLAVGVGYLIMRVRGHQPTEGQPHTRSEKTFAYSQKVKASTFSRIGNVQQTIGDRNQTEVADRSDGPDAPIGGPSGSSR